jgi:hypothetical protein
VGTVRNVALATGIDPTLPAHLATKNYVDTQTGLLIPLSQRAAANGVATLDSGTKLPIAQVPTGTTGTTVALGNHTHLLDALSNVSMSAPAALDTLSYNGATWSNSSRLYNAELLLPCTSNDLQLYGDWGSPTRRDRATATATVSNGIYLFSQFLATHTFTATKIRFFVGTAGVAGGSPSVALSIYGTSGGVPIPLLATAPVTSATFTATGIKELTLSASVAVVPGERLVALWYIAPSSYTTSPALAANPAAPVALTAPAPSNTWQGSKTASTAPGSTLNPTDGTWTAGASLVWWALL